MKLQKSLRPEHIRKFNDKFSPEAANTVNASVHATLAQQAPQEVVDALKSDKPVKKTGKLEGIAPKAVFDLSPGVDLPSSRYMMKLYHQKSQSRIRGMDPSPIHGWSTIATHALFHAAGMGDNVEDVSMANHGGKWYTVHKFEPGADYAERSINKLHNLPILKTAVMDFLIGNPDRHSGNILHQNNENILAIDHERAFQYKQLPDWGGKFQHNLRAYMNARGLKYLGDSNKDYMGDSVATWFMDNHDNIMNTFNKHVDAIQDARIKDHVTANFHSRMKYLKDSFTQYLQDREEGNIDEADPNEDMNPLHKNYPNTVRFLPIRRKSRTEPISTTGEKLEKSIKKEDWDHLLTGHNPNGSKLIDPLMHLHSTAEDVPPELVKEVFNHPEDAHNNVLEYGISPKAIFNTSGGKVMIKPYFRTDVKNTYPTFGWASAVTPKLYDAAGIGHLSDRVGVTAHKGVTFTVHPFNPNAIEAIHTTSTRAHLHDFAKIAVMDYLTNNTDRHRNNLMLQLNKDNSETPLAIDNERAFMYTRTRMGNKGGPDALCDYWNESALKNFHKQVPREEVPAIAKWWMTHAYSIKSEFQNHLKNIQDKDLAKHLLKNFDDRHKSLTKTFEPWSRNKGMLNPFSGPNTYSTIERRDVTRTMEDPEPPKINPNAPTQMMTHEPSIRPDDIHEYFEEVNKKKRKKIV